MSFLTHFLIQDKPDAGTSGGLTILLVNSLLCKELRYEPPEDRTQDPQIKSLLLYQLS